jgi:DNA-binding NarL/FixJ family response regulator
VIADDHEMLRYGVRRLLEDAPDFAVVGEAGDAAEALKLVAGAPPRPGAARYQHARHVVVRSGKLIEEHCNGTRIVYLTMHEDQEYVQQALRSGASGYLLKDTPGPLLLRALRGVHRGERSLSPQIQARLNDDAPAEPDGAGAAAEKPLTLREREVMKLLAEGNTVREQRRRLGVSVKTVEAHKFNLMRKLDIHNKANWSRSPSKKDSCDADPDVKASVSRGCKPAEARPARSGTSRSGFLSLEARRLARRQSRDEPTSGSPTPSRSPASAPVPHRDRCSARRATVDPAPAPSCVRPSENY